MGLNRLTSQWKWLVQRQWLWSFIANLFNILKIRVIMIIKVSLTYFINGLWLDLFSCDLSKFFCGEIVWKLKAVAIYSNKKRCFVVTIARRPIYNPVQHLWWRFYCENSKLLSIFTKKLHRRCFLGFLIRLWFL